MTDMTLKDQIQATQRLYTQANSELNRLASELYQLKRQCPHNIEDRIYIECNTLEPRWAYDIYKLDSTGKRIIERRYVQCSNCDDGWRELRYNDDEWYDEREWEKKARH